MPGAGISLTGEAVEENSNDEKTEGGMVKNCEESNANRFKQSDEYIWVIWAGPT